MSHKSITTPHAPRAIGPYSQAIEVDGWLFLSGQIAIDPATGKLIEGDIRAETEQVLRNIKAVLEASGVSFEAVCKATVFAVDLRDFSIINSVYQTFVGAIPPARSTIGVSALPLGAHVEIEVIARKRESAISQS